jgi:4'-phosphopantetheinyl transferase EntD
MIRTDGLFPAGVVVDGAAVGSLAGALAPEEEGAVARAVPGRREEFRTGRLCARRALARLGGPVSPLPVGPARAPIWPAGVVGTIAHAGGACLAAVAWRRAFAGIGLDLERAGAWDEALAESVLTPAEAARLRGHPTLVGVPAALAVFCAKESLYKAVQPGAGVLFGFQDVELVLEAAQAFRARPSEAAAPALSAVLERPLAAVEGRLALRDGHLLAAAWLPAP